MKNGFQNLKKKSMYINDPLRTGIIGQTDSYKITHWLQYPPGTKTIISYLESRGGLFDETVMSGTNFLLKKFFVGQVFDAQCIENAEILFRKHFGKDLFNRAGWESLLKKYGGRLPVSIKAVPEGTVINTHNVLMTIQNTDPEFFWLTNYLETLAVKMWYPISVATQSREIKKVIKKYLTDTADNLDGLNFKLHDFGYRGVIFGGEDIGGAAHLTSFWGTDTVPALECVSKFYNADVVGFSIPASEHSTITSWGRENEKEAYQNMLTQYPDGLVACVSDSYDIYHACRQIWGTDLKEEVLKRNGTLIIRPDSGKPETVILNVLEICGERFGFTVNSKGYKILDPHIRIIQGDGVNYDSIKLIFGQMKAKGWSADNIAFGMGGALLQNLNRDTQKFAFKCSAIDINDERRDVYKDPATDVGKRSKKGILHLVKEANGEYRTYEQDQLPAGAKDELVEVFRDGEILVDENFEMIRKRAEC